MKMLIKDIYKHPSDYFVHIYWILFLVIFNFLEKHITHYTILHTSIDDQIPFISYFIIPYYIWYLFIGGGILYVLIKDRAEYRLLYRRLFMGMSIFIIISIVYPNGSDIRPVYLTNTNIFNYLVNQLYVIDTPTNIFPSVHVLNTSIVLYSILKVTKHKSIKIITVLIAISIILSTLFLKQHTILDVAGGFLLAYLLIEYYQSTHIYQGIPFTIYEHLKIKS